MKESMLQSCINETRFRLSCLTTDSNFSCSKSKNNCDSVTMRFSMITSITETRPNSLFRKLKSEKIRRSEIKILQILKWCIIFRVKFLCKKKELLEAQVLRAFSQTPSYKTFLTPQIRHPRVQKISLPKKVTRRRTTRKKSPQQKASRESLTLQKPTVIKQPGI